MSLDELSAHRPVRRRRPLRSGGRGGSVQGAKIGHHDAVVDAGYAAACDDLQVGGTVPFGREALHGAGRQIEARLNSRETDVRGVQVAEGILGQPIPIEGHAALPQRDDSALARLGLAVSPPQARRRIERPRAVPGRLPMRLGDDAVLHEAARGAVAAGRSADSSRRRSAESAPIPRPRRPSPARRRCRGQRIRRRCIDPGRRARPADWRRSRAPQAAAAPTAHAPRKTMPALPARTGRTRAGARGWREVSFKPLIELGPVFAPLERAFHRDRKSERRVIVRGASRESEIPHALREAESESPRA